MFIERLGDEYVIKTSAGTMARKEIYPADFIHSRIGPKGTTAVLDGDTIQIGSQRYHLFAKSTVCVACGIQGFYYAKERHKGQEVYHLNLYGIDENGRERLMTKDHIVPKWAEGGNKPDNYQTMCTRCNSTKGGKVVDRSVKDMVVVRLATQLNVSTDFAMPRAMIKPRRLKRAIENYCKANDIEEKHAQAITQIAEMAVEDLRKRIEGLNGERNHIINVVKQIHSKDKGGKKRNDNVSTTTEGKGEVLCQV